MNINDKTFISLIRQIIRETEVDATNNEHNILKIARSRTTPKLSRGSAKALLDKHTSKYWNVKAAEDGNAAIYTNKMISTLPKGCCATEGEIE